MAENVVLRHYSIGGLGLSPTAFSIIIQFTSCTVNKIDIVSSRFSKVPYNNRKF